MADFRIDRIRFRWKSAWTTATIYIKDDFIIYQGKAYVCLIGHTSNASFYTDLGAASPNWILMQDGYEWKNQWLPSTYYDVGNIVKFNAYVYRCLTQHTSAATTLLGITSDNSKWEIVAKVTNWLHNWTVSTEYNLGDVVRYNGYVYVVNTKHTSTTTLALGLENDQSYWSQVTTSDHWSGDWTVSTRYKVSDVVKHGGILYRANQGHTSAADYIDGEYSYWDIVNSGIEYKGEWAVSNRYKLNDVIKYGPSLWKCKTEHTSNATLFTFDQTTDVSTNKWDIWLPGLEFETIWNYQTQYSQGDIVLYGGYAYTALTNHQGSVPSINGILQDTGNWELLKAGYKHMGDWGEDSSGFDYNTGDVVRLNGFLYICVSDSHDGASPDGSALWQILVTGRHHRAEWNDNTQYEKMDVVLFAGSAYLCVKQHLSTASASRPDLDIPYEQEQFWSLLIQGEATNVLTEVGDLRTTNSEVDSSMADERLGIGAAGMVLKSNNPFDATIATGTLPQWGNFGAIPKVYYVSVSNGIDVTTNGTTEGAPFKTIKYACDYIQASLAARAPATVFVKTGMYEEILPISIPADVAVVGDELRSTSVFPKAGYETSDMFYMRNGSGLRNMSLNGLSGTLGAINSYGTRRPTAGAFVSLDPGTGPADTSVHIVSKSPYVQNVSTFGTGCIGLKIDGSLHNGGYKSVVANDFTQVLTDGIGYWAKFNGVSELVSVFTYYCHIGYLAENGGRLRATNGNNSYGDFGSVAEGVNPSETAKTGTVTNQSTEAQIKTVETNGEGILAFAYSNTGSNYTGTPSITLAGSGYGASVAYEEIRKNALSEIRITDPGDSSTAGGINYTYIVNNAQLGDSVSITLSAADVTGTQVAYLGHRIVILSGAGVGQYGLISSYNNVTKIATVEREVDGTAGWEHLYPGYPIANVLNASTKYAIEPRVVVPEPAFASSVKTAPHTIGALTALGNTFISTTTNAISYSANAGTTWSSATGDITGSWDNVKAYRGTSYVTALQSGLSTTLGRSSDTGQTWTQTTVVPQLTNAIVQEAILNISRGITEESAAYPLNAYLNEVVPGTSYKRADINNSGNVNIDDVMGFLAFKNGGSNTWIETNIIPGLDFSVPLGKTWSDIAYKSDKWIAIAPSEDSTSFTEVVLSTDNGANWLPGRNISGVHTSIEFGNGIFVAIGSGNTVSTSTDCITWTSRTLPVTSNWSDIKYANGRFVAVGTSDAAIIYSFDGITWYQSYINVTNLQDSSTGTWTKVAYSGGVWVCVNETDETIITSQCGSIWSSLLDDSTTKVFATTGPYKFIAGAETTSGMPVWLGSKGTADASSVSYGAKAFVRAVIGNSRVSEFKIYDPGSGLASAPNITIYDYANTGDVTYDVRISATGVLGQPVFNNRGQDWNVASATIIGSGYSDSFQTGDTLVLTSVTQLPSPGENLIITGINDVIYKVVSIEAQSGSGPYGLTLKISPSIGRAESPAHNTAIELRENYSQIRLTGHDFLDIGTGNFSETNYPILYREGYDFASGAEPKQFNEVIEKGGGRVFYTATDQDGNFRVGEQFLVEQSTGIITLNSSLFNFSGLESLTLGGITIGGTAVVINEFSKEQTFIANSNSIVPTQKAIGAYVSSRVSGGGSEANTNALNAGQIRISTNNITTAGGGFIEIPDKMTIKGGADGHYLAGMYYGS